VAETLKKLLLNIKEKITNQKIPPKETIKTILSPYAEMLAWLNSFTISFFRSEAKTKFYSSIPMESFLALLDNIAPDKRIRKVRDKAGPFFYKGNEVGILLVHGFSSTAQEMQDLASYLNEKAGYTAFCVLIAGHGTSPSDLAQTDMVDWYKSLKEGYDFLREYCEKVFLVGHSMGGTLSFILAAHEEVNGVVSLCTPVEVEYFMQDYLFLVKDLLRFFPRRKEEIELMDKNNLINYRVSSLRAVDHLLDLMEIAKEEITGVTAPIFTVTAGRDTRVPLHNAEKIHELVQSKIKKNYFAENSIHTILYGEEKDLIMKKTLDFIQNIEQNS
jgi:carboxylesterase